MTQFVVQINVNDPGQVAKWEDCDNARFETVERANQFAAWIKKEYGGLIETNIRVESPVTPAYYEADGGSMWNGIGRTYF